MRLILKLDDWLIGNDEGTTGERIFYYGFYAVSFLAVIIVL